MSPSLAIERLHSCDDAFRKQLEKQKEVYEREMDRLTREKEEVIDQSNTKVRTTGRSKRGEKERGKGEGGGKNESRKRRDREKL